ncbi:MAG TPA: DUF4178 domain-containing protein, partial [Blastocatellia bacterium]
RGVYRGTPFEIMGRAQLGHQMGGMWDEWYAAFADGRWGWIAEAQGRFFITFQHETREQTLIPPFEMLALGQSVAAVSSAAPLVVAEKGVARPLAAKGEIPYKLIPGAEYVYADLSGPRGEFATIDYSDIPPLVFIGQEAALPELGIIGRPTEEREARRVSAQQLSCPQCAGPLELRAPDKSERVTCPNCGSLLDVSQGKLQFLKVLEGGRVRPIIPIGSVGEFSGAKLMVIGFVQRSVEFEGVRYFWEEYLLYNPEVGFRWLVRSDDNWNFVQSVPPGSVEEYGKTARFGGKQFKLYQDAVGRVEYVEGEFYWKVEQGEQVMMADYVAPPLMLSKEVSMVSGSHGQKQSRMNYAGEINWSLGTYLKREDVEKAFGITGLPSTSKIAPNQPFPHTKIFKYWGLLLLAAIALGIVFMGMGSRRLVFAQSYTLDPVDSAEKTQTRFSDNQFELRANQNIKVTLSSPVDNTWVYVEGDLINEETGLVQNFSMPIEYYHGVDGGESWSEGTKTPEMHLSALPAGKYTLRLEVQWERFQQPIALSVKLEQGVPRILHMFLALLFISIVPVLVAFYYISFNKRRWEDSDYSPFQSSEE